MGPLHFTPTATTRNTVPSPVERRRDAATRADIDALAASLLELGSQFGSALRGVLSMQRSLERIRKCQAVSPEGTLLLQEIARQLRGLTEVREQLTGQLEGATQQLDTIRCASVEPARRQTGT